MNAINDDKNVNKSDSTTIDSSSISCINETNLKDDENNILKINDITESLESLNISITSDSTSDKLLLYDTFEDNLKIETELGTRKNINITGLVYDLRCLIHKDKSEHPERPERVSAIIDTFKKEGTLDRCRHIPSRRATTEEISTVHSMEHINHMKENSEELPVNFSMKIIIIYILLI